MNFRENTILVILGFFVIIGTQIFFDIISDGDNFEIDPAFSPPESSCPYIDVLVPPAFESTLRWALDMIEYIEKVENVVPCLTSAKLAR